MNTRHVLAVLAASLALGACGSSGSYGTGASGAATGAFSSDLSQAQRLVAANSTLMPTAPDMLPGGGARFDGKVAMVFGTNPASFEAADLLGDVDIEADFRTGALTGWLDDFNTKDGGHVRGDLDMTNGRITGNAFTADFDGRLTGPATAPGTVSGTLEGSFLGNGARGVEGTGTASTGAGAATLIFQAARESD